MRKLLAFGAWVVFVVAAAVAVPLSWVAANVADEDGYVAFSEPLGSDSELQSAFGAYLADYLVRETGLPEALQPVASAAFAQGASRTANAPGFSEAWQKTQRRSHRLIFDDSQTDRLAIDLGPLATFVVDQVSAGLPVRVAAPDPLVVAINDAPEREAIDQVGATPDRARTALIVVGVAALATLLIARRRSTALAWLGLGAVGVAAGLRWVSDNGVPGILDRTEAPSSFARTLQKLLADRASDSLGQWLLVIAIGGAVAVVVGLMGRAASSQR